MQCLFGLAALISLASSAVPSYYDTRTGQADLDTTDAANAAQWTVLQKSCWRDAADGVRSLDHAAENFDASWTTPGKCRAACQAEGYALAAVEYGHECWCGNTIAGHAYPVHDAYCNEPCSGDDSQMCGGFGYMNLWAQNTYDFLQSGEELDPNYAWKPIACFKDADANHRLLPFQPKHGVEPERMRTVEGCIEACQGHGYDYAGLENGAECWCGGKCPSEHLRGGKCDMPCKGNSKQYCGGQHSLLVYRRNGIAEQETRETSEGQMHKNQNQALASGPVNVLKYQVEVSAAVPHRLPGFAPNEVPDLSELPDLGEIVKQIKPIVSNMFTAIQSDVALSKKTAAAILNHIPQNPPGTEMESLLIELLKDLKLDAANPVRDAIDKVRTIVSTMFDKISKDVASIRTAALLLLDHLPRHSLGNAEREDEDE